MNPGNDAELSLPLGSRLRVHVERIEQASASPEALRQVLFEALAEDEDDLPLTPFFRIAGLFPDGPEPSPPIEVEQRVLAAARAAIEQSCPPSWSERLRDWSMGHGAWKVAGAALAAVLGVLLLALPLLEPKSGHPMLRADASPTEQALGRMLLAMAAAGDSASVYAQARATWDGLSAATRTRGMERQAMSGAVAGAFGQRIEQAARVPPPKEGWQNLPELDDDGSNDVALLFAGMAQRLESFEALEAGAKATSEGLNERDQGRLGLSLVEAALRLERTPAARFWLEWTEARVSGEDRLQLEALRARLDRP